ncbi:MAG TPA: IS1380 family transposase [Solirubrobacteraceae bacterium]
MANRTGLLPYTIEIVEDADAVTAHAGLPLVLETMRKLGVSAMLDTELGVRQRNNGATDSAKAEAIVLLMACGGDCFSDIDVLRADKGFQRLIGAQLSTQEVLRTFLYAFHDDKLIDEAQRRRAPGEVAYIPAETSALQGLGRVNIALAHEVSRQMKLTAATLDHDATIQESHKKQAMAHYDGGRGYQPSVLYWVEADQILGDEYRDGNVPAAMGNLPLIQKGFSSLPASIKTYFLRGDSALYDQAVLKWLADENRNDGPKGFIGFSISADMFKPLRAMCEALPDDDWTLVEERANETVFAADVEFTSGDWSKDAKPLRYVAVKFVGRQMDLEGKVHIKYLAVVTNRHDLEPADLLTWHWQKAGTIEHVHDVLKNDLGGATPPCGRFGANAAWFRFARLTYNVLSAMKQLALPPSMETARPKRLRFALFSLAARITSHAGSLVMKIGRAAEQFADLVASRLRLAKLAVT